MTTFLCTLGIFCSKSFKHSHNLLFDRLWPFCNPKCKGIMTTFCACLVILCFKMSDLVWCLCNLSQLGPCGITLSGFELVYLGQFDFLLGLVETLHTKLLIVILDSLTLTFFWALLMESFEFSFHCGFPKSPIMQEESSTDSSQSTSRNSVLRLACFYIIHVQCRNILRNGRYICSKMNSLWLHIIYNKANTIWGHVHNHSMKFCNK